MWEFWLREEERVDKKEVVVFLREVALEDFDSFGKIDDFIWDYNNWKFGY